MNSTFLNNISDTNTVTECLRNSHCIICGTPFNTVRVGKLYCSDKCKQFAYNHKEKIFQSENIAGKGINAKPQTFYFEEYQYYDKKQKMLKRYKELSKKQTMWKVAESEVINCKRENLQINNYTWERYISRRLNENEDGELYNLETEIEEEIKTLSLRELSIEQWSFIKSLYTSFQGVSLCELINSFGSDFFSQLNLSPVDRNINENVTIKNKYINHCNLFAEGLIKFVKKPINDENEN